jgi:hypothetical protein
LNTWATDYITSELDKLAVREKYVDQDQIHGANGGGMQITHIGQSTLYTPHQFHGANGGGMQITHIGQSTLYTPSRNLARNDVLHVPASKKNVVSIHRFTRDNHVFIEYHPYVFFG